MAKVRHKKRSHRRRVVKHNPVRDHRYQYARNKRRRYHRNPSRSGGAVAIFRPMTWLPQVLTGGVAAGVTVLSPRAWGAGVTVTQAYLTQAGVGLGGAFLLRQVGMGRFSAAWLIGAGAIVIGDFVGRTLAQALGLSAYPYELSGLEDPYGSYYTGHLNAYPGGESTLFEPPTALRGFDAFEEQGQFAYGQ